MSGSTSPVASPTHAHNVQFHFEPHEVEQVHSAPAAAPATPGQTDAELTTAVEFQIKKRDVGARANLGEAVAAREGITPPRRRLSVEVDGPSPDRPLTVTTPTHDGPPEIETFEPPSAAAGQTPPPQPESTTSSRRFCGCLEGWLPSCIIDFFEWICCCFCCYNTDETAPFSPNTPTPLTRLPPSRFRSTDETEIRILTQIEFAIRDRAGNLTQNPPSDRCKIIALLDMIKEGESKPFFSDYHDFYAANSFAADTLSSKFIPTGEGKKLRHFQFAFITIDGEGKAQIHVFTYNEKSDRPRHEPVIRCTKDTLAEQQGKFREEFQVLERFHAADFGETLRSPIARTPSPSTLEVIGRSDSA